MKKILFVVFVLTSLISQNVFAQGTNCGTATPFCTATPSVFAAPAQQGNSAPAGPDYDCLFSQPNPTWFYLQVSTSGSITVSMSTSAGVDIDFALWGPYTSPSAGCASGLTTQPVACSYDSYFTTPVESGTIPTAVAGEFYILLITNFSGQATNITLSQTAGSGATSCNIVCLMSAITAVPDSCQSPANLYNLNGVLNYSNPPSTGTLTISNSSNNVTQVFNAPFDTATVSYLLTGLPADGNPCTVTAVFSNDPSCTITQTFNAPPPCFVDCPIQVDSARTCEGVPATLTATGANSYIWSTGATTATILASGVNATYTVIGITGTCADTVTTTVTTFPPPTVSFSGDTLSGCEQLDVNFTADTTGNAGATYNWVFGHAGATATGMVSSHLYSEPGCYTVSLTASFGPGCTTTDSTVCMIDVLTPPMASFSVSPDDIDAIASTAYFSNTSVGSALWLWNFGDSASSTLQHPEHTYADVGSYPVTLYAFSTDGCIDSLTVNVLVKDIVTFYMPNTFTPNKNGINEVFYMYAYGVVDANYEMIIFDRWGKEIFKTTDRTVGWNGSLNNTGATLAADTYVYRINYKEATGKRKTALGHVTLVR